MHSSTSLFVLVMLIHLPNPLRQTNNSHTQVPLGTAHTVTHCLISHLCSLARHLLLAGSPFSSSRPNSPLLTSPISLHADKTQKQNKNYLCRVALI